MRSPSIKTATPPIRSQNRHRNGLGRNQKRSIAQEDARRAIYYPPHHRPKPAIPTKPHTSRRCDCLRQVKTNVVMVANSNRLPDLIPLIPQVCNALETIAPGQVIEIE